MAEEEEVKETAKKGGCIFIPSFLLGFVVQVTDNVFTDIIVYRTCLITLNNNGTNCFTLRANASSPEAVDLEAKVEPYASMILMTKCLTDSLLPAVLSLLLGPWSDRGGRRPLLLAGYAGCTISFFALSFICDWNISPWYLLLTWIPQNIVGGGYTLLLACVCYVTDTTDKKYRMGRLALLEASISAGDLVGALVGPLIYANFGHANVFRVATVGSASALVYVYFLITESVKNTSKKSVRGLLSISLFKDTITSLSIKRDGFRRSVIWLGISAFTLNAIINGGHLTITFLFTRVRLGWDVQRYSYYFATSIVLRIIGLCGVSSLGSILGVPDIVLAGIGFVSNLGGAITKSLAWYSWHMYLSVCIGIFGGIVGPVMRSTISKSVPAQDVGKVLSLMAFLDASSPLAGAPLFTLIYSHYLPPIYPSPVYLLSSGLYILSIIFIASISILMRKSRKPPTYVAGSQDDKTINHCMSTLYID